MPAITVTETVQAPRDRVFAIAADIPSAAATIDGIDAVEVLTPSPEHPSNLGPVGLGFAWRETRTMLGRKATEVMAITAWHPPESYVVEARSHGCHYRTPITFEAIDPATTRMTMTFTATPETLMAKVMMKLFAAMAKHAAKCITNDLRDIKRAAESK